MENLQNELKEIFAFAPEADEFIKLWNKYIHLIDDVIDESPSSERTLEAFALAEEVYTHKFYLANIAHLSAIKVMIDNTFADSVIWEKSGEDWKIAHADSLRHCAYDMFFATIYIIAGRETLRRVSARFREFSHKKHLEDFSKIKE